MAVYEYSCGACGTVFEHIQKITEEAKKELACPVCETIQPVKRLVSSSNFRCFGQCSPYTPKGSRQSKVKSISGQFYDEDSWKAKKKGVRPRKGTTIRR
jgi:putative FmdB family regulatory protein